ncbi:hypothetical protein MnTg04_00866 [bacterium MnTg04]|nr:hypothetical protein MnTg04_00866 [bacterium MnTg04]
MKQVFPERSLFDQARQVLVGRRQHPNIHFDRLLPAHPVKLPLGQHPQQASLQRGRHVADFVEEQSTAIRLFETAVMLPRRPGKRAFFMAEQLRLEQFRRDCGRVQRNKGLAGTR